jgi:hypothetical protein
MEADMADNETETTQGSGVAPATEFNPSGAPQQIVPDVDPAHPAVDNDPRANTTAEQNRIDFNDPTKSGSEVVAEQLGMSAPEDDQKSKGKGKAGKA